MFKNYFKTAIRSLLRHRFFSSINIFGLSVAMALSMAIIMLVADQMMYDRYNTKRDRIYRVNSIPLNENGSETNETATTTLPLRQELLENYTGIEKAVRIVRGFGNNWMELDNNNVNIPIAGYYTDPEFFEVFEHELEYGNSKNALVEPYSVVLSKKAAKKLFKQENPVGETFTLGDEGTYKVTGVLKETTNKTHIAFEALASISTLQSLEALGKRKKEINSWYSAWEGWVYVLLEKGKNKTDVQPYFEKIQKKYFTTLPNPETQHRIKYSLQNIMNITPGAFINNPIGPFLPWVFVYFFIGLAAIVMLTSCFNFTNLSIARSLTRAREIGVRKVTGAMRWQVFVQFLSESIIISLLSLAVAILILIASRPLFEQLSFARLMRWDLEVNYFIYGVFIVFAIVVGVIAGFFPAVVLSGFQPVKVLKGMNSMKLFSGIKLRKTLLVAQFTFSLIFIISVIVVFNQLQLFLKADHGFNMENKIIVGLNNTSSATLKNELLKHSNIESVTAVSHVLAAGSTYGSDYKRSLDEKDWTNLCYYSVDEDYLKNLEVPMVAGNFFKAENGDLNKKFIVLSEKAIETFHFKSAAEAIGQELILQKDSSRKQIIGVAKNYNHQLLVEKLEPLALIYNSDEYKVLQVKYSGTYENAGKSVEEAWSKVNPSLKVDYKDFSIEVHKIYDIFFGDIVSILSVIAFLAIVISCLGLLGMATYTTETRIKEISIRKILGSTDKALVYLLSRGFVIILLIAIGIAAPLSYFINTLWLEQLAYHVSVDFVTIFLGVIALLLFGMITIGSQAWRAIYINPVKNLKSE